MRGRGKHCRHTKHTTCIGNACAGFYRSMKNGFVASIVLSLVPLLTKGRVVKAMRELASKDRAIDSLKLALFAGFLNSFYKAVLCMVRRCFSDCK